ncbi:MAG TPA: prenyltransferase/squalene oxidase repeat-containing protein [Planctomycetaceae bacterium]|nr:prenyltransferase/squalene oxidase repeat-containing protein [Planctomycetaceae bacterium]
MNLRHFLTAAAITLGATCVTSNPARCDDPASNTSSNSAPSKPKSQLAVERSLSFLEHDAQKWRKEHECATCHHGTLTVWALNEAHHQGYQVKADVLKDMAEWTKARWVPEANKPRDTRPGWSMVSTPAVYLGVMDQILPERKILSADERDRIVGSLIRHQEADGSWDWSAAPAKNRPPPVFESNEVVTLWAYMALEPHKAVDPQTTSPARDSREKAVAWLSKTEPTQTTQALALRLLVDVRSGKSPELLRPKIDELLGLQKPDGGWSQLKELSSDAYATGQVLYVLNLAGVPRDRAEIQRGATFLINTQREDGSWPMTSRSHPGVEKPMTNPVPITYFGSAWATIGLVRSLPK